MHINSHRPHHPGEEDDLAAALGKAAKRGPSSTRNAGFWACFFAAWNRYKGNQGPQSIAPSRRGLKCCRSSRRLVEPASVEQTRALKRVLVDGPSTSHVRPRHAILQGSSIGLAGLEASSTAVYLAMLADLAGSHERANTACSKAHLEGSPFRPANSSRRESNSVAVVGVSCPRQSRKQSKTGIREAPFHLGSQ